MLAGLPELTSGPVAVARTAAAEVSAAAPLAGAAREVAFASLDERAPLSVDVRSFAVSATEFPDWDDQRVIGDWRPEVADAALATGL
jgi:hypothetical protein